MKWIGQAALPCSDLGESYCGDGLCGLESVYKQSVSRSHQSWSAWYSTGFISIHIMVEVYSRGRLGACFETKKPTASSSCAVDWEWPQPKKVKAMGSWTVQKTFARICDAFDRNYAENIHEEMNLLFHIASDFWTGNFLSFFNRKVLRITKTTKQ